MDTTLSTLRKWISQAHPETTREADIRLDGQKMMIELRLVQRGRNGQRDKWYGAQLALDWREIELERRQTEYLQLRLAELMQRIERGGCYLSYGMTL